MRWHRLHSAQWRVVVEGWNIISNAITDVTNASGTTLVAGYDYDVYYDIEEVAKYAPTLSVDAAEALAVYFDRDDLNSTGVKLERFSETAAVDLDVFNKNADDASVDSTKNCVNVSVKDMTPEKTMCVISGESYGETVYFAFFFGKVIWFSPPNNVPQRSTPRAPHRLGGGFSYDRLSVLLRFAVAISGGKFVPLQCHPPPTLGGGPLALGVSFAMLEWRGPSGPGGYRCWPSRRCWRGP